MPVNVTATLRKAVQELEAEKARIERQLAAIRSLLGSLDNAKGRAVRVAPRGRTRRRRITAAARRALSQRMKAYWAKRRAASAKRKSRAAVGK